MAQVYIGSARHDENGKLNGKEGDQLQTGAGNDFKGEVSMQTYYSHKLGWNGLRFNNIAFRHKVAERMVAAANNANIGYSQKGRAQILKNGIDTKKKTNCNCSSLLREVFIETTGKDPGAFSTEDAKTVLLATGLVKSISVVESDLQVGDILITKKKGYCAVVVLGKTPEEPKKDIYYPTYYGRGTSIVSALETVGEKDTSFVHRKKIAFANGFKSYSGTIKENLTLLTYLKCGQLKKA